MFYESCSKCIHRNLLEGIQSLPYVTYDMYFIMSSYIFGYIRSLNVPECGLHKQKKCICVFACVKNYIIYSNQSHYIARNWYYKRTTGLFSKRPKRKMRFLLFFYFNLAFFLLLKTIWQCWNIIYKVSWFGHTW